MLVLAVEEIAGRGPECCFGEPGFLLGIGAAGALDDAGSAAAERLGVLHPSARKAILGLVVDPETGIDGDTIDIVAVLWERFAARTAVLVAVEEPATQTARVAGAVVAVLRGQGAGLEKAVLLVESEDLAERDVRYRQLDDTEFLGRSEEHAVIVKLDIVIFFPNVVESEIEPVPLLALEDEEPPVDPLESRGRRSRGDRVTGREGASALGGRLAG